ncbi:sigma-70 family RNA polymerase sigma factor [Gloeobacter kilaueensis]|uniref:RNA polymerase sigma factor SigF n=1 Tax=Gloeobacter kilaueensis (strain ATCC BAA-2537 / CCAP 1431/1 / ULC 316 / JS1) TaxID=1183438 RepID=U5QH45_GLOK1|nr:sigma-70 family RNA polymerase sigma factor [Gloeobacter kilaueensis]AGY58261.1 RNA polymerase sigma factor SigF [Gloeobacter kilaueensis JS1]
MDNILPFEQRFPRQSKAEQLHQLAVVLQPIERKRQQVVAAAGLSSTEKIQCLGRLEREASRAGLGEFHGVLERLCREFCRRSPAGSHPRFDAELLSEEVKLMVHARLPQFDPERGHFGPWFKVYVLLPVYKRLCSEIDVDWGRRVPQTDGGRVRRWLRRWAHAPLSLDAPVGTTQQDGDLPALGETVASKEGSPENQLLEDQCRERFLRALERLAEAERLLVERVHLRGERQQEVARSVRLTPGRVSQKLKRAAERLAEILGENFEDDCGGTAFCRGLSEGRLQPATGPAGASGTVARAAFEQALPELVRRSGWQGTVFAPPELAGGPVGELLDELLAGPAPSQVWASGSRALQVASAATGAVAAAWALFVFVPSELQPPLRSPIEHRPQPATAGRPFSTPIKSAAKQPIAATSSPSPRTVSAASSARSAQQSASSATSQTQRSMPRPQDKHGLSISKAGTAGASKRVQNFSKTETKRPPANTGRLPDRVREPDDLSIPSDARNLCAALAAAAPVPAGLAGFAVIEATLGADGTPVEGSPSPEIIVSGGEQVDALVLGALQTLLAAGRLEDLSTRREATLRSGRYRVALEAEQHRWSCHRAAQDPQKSVPASGASSAATNKYE